MRVVDLSTLSEYEARQGDVLTGVATEESHITIADGATVTLRSVTISANPAFHEWAPLTCLGDACIILDGINSIRSHHHRYPGILAAPGKTLVIDGFGSLSVSSVGNGAGVGGGYQVPCGNIHIKNGFIVAQGGMGACGIGGGYYAACGSILIEGGTITALGGSMSSAIGSGLNGSCGDVTIGPHVIYLTAKKGECGDYPADDIGRGPGGSCGAVANFSKDETLIFPILQ